MTRGRKRTFNPDIPTHIDQSALPRGVYWADGRWYTFEPHPDGGRPRKVTIGYATARLSDLHALMESRAGGGHRGTLGWIIDQFEQSGEFSALAAATRRDYKLHAKVARAYVLRNGQPLGHTDVDRISLPTVQRLVETLAMGREAAPGVTALPARPSTANHVLRYLRRLFAWALRHGHCRHNPARGARQAQERGRHTMPAHGPFDRVLQFAMRRASRPFRSSGAGPAYLPAVMVLAYNLRLRGIEVCTLTDASRVKGGVRTNRRKGSRDNITRWNREMHRAWACLVLERRRALRATGRRLPTAPDRRQLIVTHDGTPLAKSSLDTAWQRLITAAIAAGVITQEERFSLHGLKHRGITDTQGNRAEKQDASGHVDPRMVTRYDHDVPTVEPPRRR